MRTAHRLYKGTAPLFAVICLMLTMSNNALAQNFSNFVLPQVTPEIKVLPAPQPKSVAYIAYDATNYSNSQNQQKDLSEASSKPTLQKPAKLMANGDYVVSISPDGHYYLAGSINGFPVNFMVDTGADHCTVDASMAKNLGIRAGMSISVDTASGRTTAGSTSGNAVTLPNVSFTNAHVMVMEGLRTALLGSEVLNKLNISYGQGVMTISKVAAR